ncbi:hypothetical protein ACQEU3_36875 [Spirillospora sp. CA-253888]
MPPDFSSITRRLDERWARTQRLYALGYEEERHRVRISWIPAFADDETWFDLYQMAVSVEQDIALV